MAGSRDEGQTDCLTMILLIARPRFFPQTRSECPYQNCHPVMSIETRHVKYIFADVVGFTEGRTVDAQVEIIGTLNKAFATALDGLNAIFLPTGDGICAGIIAMNAPADAHLQGALAVLK